MRNYINLLDSVLFESRGLGARRTGEEFVSVTNPEYKIYFDNVKFYPEGGTQYPSYDVMVMELQKLVKGYPGTINLIKKFINNYKYLYSGQKHQLVICFKKFSLFTRKRC